MINYRDLSRWLIDLSSLPCVILPLSRHVLIKTATIDVNHPNCVQTSFSSTRSSYAWTKGKRLLTSLQTHGRLGNPNLAGDINGQSNNGFEPHRSTINHNPDNALPSSGTLLLTRHAVLKHMTAMTSRIPRTTSDLRVCYLFRAMLPL